MGLMFEKITLLTCQINSRFYGSTLKLDIDGIVEM